VVEIQGNVSNETGMIMDFKEFKDKISEVIDKYDHNLLLYKGDHLAKVFEDKEINCMVLPYIPTAEKLAKDIGSQLLAKFNPTDVDIFKVEFWETPKNCAIWELGR
jgi:6-pyruvoyl-tetrahydropterin synthase